MESSRHYLHKVSRILQESRDAINIWPNELGCEQNHCCLKGVAVLCKGSVHVPDISAHPLQAACLIGSMPRSHAAPQLFSLLATARTSFPSAFTLTRNAVHSIELNTSVLETC